MMAAQWNRGKERKSAMIRGVKRLDLAGHRILGIFKR
jgi:hypothetical protein